MNKHNFNQTGLYPLNTERLQELQTSFSLFNQLGWALGNFCILDGCVNNAGVVTNGFVFYNGEVYPFVGGNAQDNVRLYKTNVDRPFQNGAVKTVYEQYVLGFGIGEGSVAWSNFKRPAALLNITERIATLENALQAATAKLETIDENAQVNVQSDYTQGDDKANDYIKNKPSITDAFLYKGEYNVGDVESNDVDRTVSFPSVDTSNYIVVGSLVSLSGNFNTDNDVIWSVKSLSEASFRLILREVSGNVQNLVFKYALIPL